MYSIFIYVIAGIVVVVGSYCKGYIHGKGVGEAELHNYERSIQTESVRAIENRVAENSKLREVYENESKVKEQKYEEELRKIRTALSVANTKRVPISANFCSERATPTREASETSGSVQDPSDTRFLPESFTRDLRQLAAEADEITEQARVLQETINSSNCYK